MLLLTGTVPLDGFGVVEGKGRLERETVVIGERRFAVSRGTPAMIAATLTVCRQYGLEPPLCVVSGDSGRGEGSTQLYQYLKKNISLLSPDVIVFHYIMPNWYYHDEVMAVVRSLDKKPVLIADAGYMYAAKMSGAASSYTIFTPDLGELAFLADLEAPHPFYTRGFIFHMEDKAEELIKLAYQEEGAAEYLLVKGKRDYICHQGKIIASVDAPDVPELEPIGGTGDTVTGMVAGLMAKGFREKDALLYAAQANRIAGKLTHPTPATQVVKIIEKIPLALNKVVGQGI